MFSHETPTPVTTASRAAGETPFSLVYGTEACLPPKILMGSPWVWSFDESMQEQLRHEDVDFIDERRWQATIRNARYYQALGRYRQWFVHSRELGVGGPGPKANSEPRRAPQTPLQLGRTLQGDESMPTLVCPPRHS
jgi:hypothetical protein